MKTWKYMALALVALLSFAACGDDDEDEPNIPEQGATYTQTLSVSAEGFTQTITLNNLKKEPVVKGETSWAKVEAIALSNGSVQATMNIAANTTQEARTASLQFVAAPDTLVLTVYQSTDVSIVDVDTPTDEESNQPALSR